MYVGMMIEIINEDGNGESKILSKSDHCHLYLIIIKPFLNSEEKCKTREN